MPLAYESYQIAITEHPNHLENPNYPVEVILENPNQWDYPYGYVSLSEESYQIVIIENQWQDPHYCAPLL